LFCFVQVLEEQVRGFPEQLRRERAAASAQVEALHSSAVASAIFDKSAEFERKLQQERLLTQQAESELKAARDRCEAMQQQLQVLNADSRDCPMSRTAAFNGISVTLPVTDVSVHTIRIQELESQIRMLKARLSIDASDVCSRSSHHMPVPSDVGSPNTLQNAQLQQQLESDKQRNVAQCFLDLSVDYGKYINGHTKRHDTEHMKTVFQDHKDCEGLSKTALMKALKAVDAPLLSSSDGASEESVFSRADTNCSKYVDLNE
jgi:hypothetical protein